MRRPCLGSSHSCSSTHSISLCQQLLLSLIASPHHPCLHREWGAGQFRPCWLRLAQRRAFRAALCRAVMLLPSRVISGPQ